MGFVTRGVAAVALLGTVAMAAPAQATLFTYQFGGVVSDVGTGLAATFSVGQVVSGSWTVDSTVAPSTVFPTSADFPAVTAFSVTIGTYTASGTGGLISVLDGNFVSGTGYRVSTDAVSTGNDVNGQGPGSLFVFLEQATAGTFNPVTTLPTTLELASFSNPFGRLSFDRDDIDFTITSLTLVQPPTGVPVPGSLALLGAGLLGLFGLRRVV
jgi:hypothetical protein